MTTRVKLNEPPKRESGFDNELISSISEAVYRMRLGGDSEAERMIEKDGDDGQKLRNRSGGYDSLTRCYLNVLTGMGFIKQ